MRSGTVGRFSKGAVPPAALFSRMPSISTSVWLLFEPRRNTPLVCPSPPLAVISTLACCCSSSVNVSCPAALDYLGSVMSSIGWIVADRGSGVRVAVTTTGSALRRVGRSGSSASALAAAIPAATMPASGFKASPPCDCTCPPHARLDRTRKRSDGLLIAVDARPDPRRPRFPS